MTFKTKPTLLLAVTILIFVACRKTEFKSEPGIEVQQQAESRFFTITANTQPIVRKLASEIERRNNQLHFIENFARQKGYAQWNNAIIAPLRKGTEEPSFLENTSNGSDSVVYVPLVLAGTNYTNGFIRAEMGDSIVISDFMASQYAGLPFQSVNSDTTTGHQFASFIMMMDNQIFGHTYFGLTDSRLLNTGTGNGTTATRSAKLVGVTQSTPGLTEMCAGTIYNISWLVADPEHCTCANGICIDWASGCTDCSNTVTITITVAGDGGCGGGTQIPSLPPVSIPTPTTSGGTWNSGPTGGGGGTIGWVLLEEPLTPAQQAIANQLNTLLTQGDSYYFIENPSPSNSLIFQTVAEFQNYLQSNALNQTFDLTTPPTIINTDEKFEYGKFNLTFLGGVEVTCKLTKTGNVWDVTNVTSDDYGLTIGWQWEHTDYTKSTASNEITLLVSGYVRYNIIFDGVGTIYKEKMKFQLKINAQTGKITSLSKG